MGKLYGPNGRKTPAQQMRGETARKSGRERRDRSVSNDQPDDQPSTDGGFRQRHSAETDDPGHSR